MLICRFGEACSLEIYKGLAISVGGSAYMYQGSTVIERAKIKETLQTIEILESHIYLCETYLSLPAYVCDLEYSL